MPTNEFLPFATAGGANVESQAAYSADPQRAAGFQTGIAPSAPFNKAWRQACFMAAVIGQLIVDTLTVDCLDDGNIASHETLLSNTIKAIIATVGYAPIASPAFTGTPTAPTVAGTSDSSTKIATTAFVQAVRALLAPLASPAFTGTPTAPTPSSSDNSTRVATTAFVKSRTQFFVSPVAGFAYSANLSFAHGLGALPAGAIEETGFILINTSSEFGYSPGMRVSGGYSSFNQSVGLTTSADDTNLYADVNSGIYVQQHGVLGLFGPTAAKWNVQYWVKRTLP